MLLVVIKCACIFIQKEVPDQEHPNNEVWNSGRPKRRSCIKSKRVSADERLVVDNKTYYKVEVMTTKLRSSAPKERNEVKHTAETVELEEERDEKGLIVKFKKLRNSEITLLNNEAENFLFPKKVFQQLLFISCICINLILLILSISH